MGRILSWVPSSRISGTRSGTNKWRSPCWVWTTAAKPRYTTGCHAILFVVDTTDTERMFLARHELHILLDEYLAKAKSPILVVANKVDVHGHLSEVDLVQALNLDYITENEWKVIGTSALTGQNVDRVADWLVQTSRNITI